MKTDYWEKHKKTQSELGRVAGYSRSMICKILSGDKKPCLSGAFRLESITGIPARLWAFGSPEQIQKAFYKWARRG